MIMNTVIKNTVVAVALGLSISSGVSATTVQSVTFESGNNTLVGNLFLPEITDPQQKLRAVIVTGSWTSVKEQMSGAYAEKLAQLGYVALAFDFSGWGESVSKRPYVEDPALKIQEIIDAATFLSSLPEIDPAKIGGLGICASAGYMVDAALRSDNIKTTALIAPWLHNAEIVEQVYGDNIPALMAASEKAEQRFEQSGELSLLPAASDTDETAVMYQAPYYSDPARGAIREYDNKFNLMTWKPWLTYDAIQAASKLTKPTLLVHSDSAAIPQGAKTFVENGGDNIQLTLLDEVTQFDFYDDPNAMKQALGLVKVHLENTL
jgi:fermentation-respiration switch protein FrsA (DUF1100 family)